MMLDYGNFMHAEFNFNFNICCNEKYEFFNMQKTHHYKIYQIDNILNVENIIICFQLHQDSIAN